METRPMREERKVVTALFADVVGSTALAERLDPEEAKLVVGEAVARIVHAVEAFGGTVKDLAGDGVLALFGAPAAHEDDPERAVRAGIRIVEDLRAYGEEVAAGWGIEGFGVRVGVNSGPVVLGPVGAGSRVEYGAVGDAVNTAARLQGSAEPGTVLVGEDTRRPVDPLFRWGERSELAVKGKAEPVVASAALGVAAAQARPPDIRTALVGREREVASASEPIEAVLAGAGGILFVTGEAGIGKSRLVAELRARLEAATAAFGRPLWIEGRCVSYGESIPYWPFRDLVRNWLGPAEGEPELRVRVALRRGVERLFGDRTPEIHPYLGAMLGLTLEPDAEARLRELSPEALQYRTFEVMRTLVERLAEEGPLVLVVEDLHWADPTSVQLAEELLAVADRSAVLLLLTGRPERDHPFWRLREVAERRFPHRAREVALEALSGRADRELLHALVGGAAVPPEVEDRVLSAAEGNPFFLEELVRSLADHGALVAEGIGWRFDHAVLVDVPPTVEKVILARIDRLTPKCHHLLMAASVLGRQFGLPLLQVVSGDGEDGAPLMELQRLDLLREGRRWPEPEYRFKHALIQEAAYRTILSEERKRLHRKAAQFLEEHHGDEAPAILAHHWLAAKDEDKAITFLTRAGDRARQEYALDEAVDHYRALLPLLERRGERQEMALVLFKLALALHTSLRFAEANQTYQRAFDLWMPPPPWPGEPTATVRVATSFLPNDPDPLSAIAWPNIQLCMQLFDRLVEAWPERTLVPSLAERWEIADDGLRYLFHLRHGLQWSDGVPLTAHDVEFGIKRVLDPRRPGASVAIYFVLDNGQAYYLGEERDPDRIGVRALDDRTVEFRLAAPAPYFMSVMNRPDGGPQPRHAIEAHGDDWTTPELQVVSGPFRQVERTEGQLVLERQPNYSGVRPGNVRRLEFASGTIHESVPRFEGGEIDLVLVRYTPRLADVMPAAPTDASIGPAAWTFYLSFDHANPITSNVNLRLALAHAIDRQALSEMLPVNLAIATGGLVPPALQGHTPDIAPRFDPDLARSYLERSGVDTGIAIGAFEEWASILAAIAEGWERVLGLRFEPQLWTAPRTRWDRLPTVGSGGSLARPGERFPIILAGWLPGYPDPEYYLRLLLHSDSKTNEGGFAYPPFDELIERARQERSDRARLELFHEADRMAVAEQVALIPIAYGRSMAFVKPWVRGWWEFGKSSSSFADLTVDRGSPRSGA